jgi:protein arginine N-methyltransferase 5
MSNVVAVSSSWIDLCSPDPLIADISRQVLLLEVAYAAFCGASYIIIRGPRLHHDGLHAEGVPYFARAVQEAMSMAPYIHMHIWLQMIDNPDLELNEMGDLARFARAEYLSEWQVTGPSKMDLFGTWDAWNIIRTVCKYHSRLLVGKNYNRSNPPLPSVMNTNALCSTNEACRVSL